LTKILLVDDEKDITDLIKKGLEKRGFEVDTFNHPKEALSRFKPNTYDLILLDVRMPTMDGYQLYEELKKKDPGAKIHFITAFEFIKDAPKQMITDMIGKNFIQKPLTINKLVEIINERIKGM
jgi:DNA-binding NtrC family response regulator